MDYLNYLFAVIAVIAFGFAIKYWWQARKFTRERFAFAFLTYVGSSIFAIVNLSLSSRFFNLLALGTGQTNTVNFDLIIITTLIITSYVIIYQVWKNWHGEISVIQHERQQEKIPDSPALLVLDSLELLRDLTREEKRTEPYIPPVQYEVKFLPELVWHKQAKELLCLDDSKLYFRDDDWHESHNCWIGEHTYINNKVVLLCWHDRLADKVLLQALDYARQPESLDKNNIEVIVALKEGDIEEKRKISGYQVPFISESKLLDKCADFTSHFANYFRFIKDIVTRDKFPDLGLTIEDMYVISDYRFKDDEHQTDIEQFIYEWLENEGSLQQLAVLGEYGHGKTTLAQMLTYKLLLRCREDKNARIPILLELRGKSPRTLTPEHLLATWGDKYGIKSEALKQLLVAGRLLIIFEGFDEMDLAMDKKLRLQNFISLWEGLYYKNAKLLFTGRPNFFFDTEEQRLCLRENVSSENDYGQTVNLEFFSIEQIEASLAKLPNPTTREEIIALVNKNPKFKEIVSRPSILRMATTVWEKKLSKYKEQINSARVIDEFIKSTHERQTKKYEHKLYEVERIYFMEAIAVYMVVNDLPNQISSSQLSKVIRDLVEKMPKEVSLSAKNVEPSTLSTLF